MKTPEFIKRLYPQLIWNIESDKKKIYLTFDDGPTPGVTDKLLNILKQYNVKATFFCIARNVERNPKIYNKIISEGHQVGNHTYSHLNGWKSTNNEYYNDIKLAEQFINSNLFRPPYGKIKRLQIKCLRKNYKIIMWDVMSMDFKASFHKKKCLQIVQKKTKPGSIIVFHDSLKASEKILYIVPQFIQKFTSLGYTFDVLN